MEFDYPALNERHRAACARLPKPDDFAGQGFLDYLGGLVFGAFGIPPHYVIGSPCPDCRSRSYDLDRQRCDSCGFRAVLD